MAEYANKIERLDAELRELSGALVAFSGGVDSSMLLHAAKRVLGAEKVWAITADSPSFPRAEKEAALELAKSMKLRHVLIDTDELARAGYRENGPDRCYFCKTELFEDVLAGIKKRDFPDWPVLYGAISDDMGDHRPGARAAAEHGVLAPLAKAGLSKDDVRRYSREHGLPTWDKPSFACLSSRIPYGTSIDAKLLNKVERAEAYLRMRGYRQFRVRHHGDLARVEVEHGELARIVTEDREGLLAHLESLGYLYVTIDLRGFRSGSMNEGLNEGRASADGSAGTGAAASAQSG